MKSGIRISNDISLISKLLKGMLSPPGLRQPELARRDLEEEEEELVHLQHRQTLPQIQLKPSHRNTTPDAWVVSTWESATLSRV